jgi:chromodomain-helicase-DNA-binding protein 1
MEALGRTSSRTLTKKDKKAVLFEHHGVKRINAETILDRPDEMLLLQNVTSAVADPRSFRIPDATKGAGYSCNWGAREDGMLCVGIARHGYGAWEKIRDDSDLGLSDKLFLEEHRVDKKAERERQEGKNAKSPGAVHLVRRADYLISVLKGKVIGDPAAKKAVENHHRNNKKNCLHDTSNLNGATSFSASPVPSAQRKPPRDSDKHRQRAMSHGHRESMERHATPRLEHRHSQGVREDGHREKKHRHSEPHHHHHRHKSNDYQTNGAVGGDAGDDMLKLIFKPVRESLKIIQSATKSNLPDAPARANILREHLRILGNFVRATLDDDGASLEGRLW